MEIEQIYKTNYNVFYDKIYKKVQQLIKIDLKKYAKIFAKYDIYLIGGSLLRAINDEIPFLGMSKINISFMHPYRNFDYDLYSNSYDNIKNCIEELLNNYPELSIQYETETSITLFHNEQEFNLQFIHNKEFIGDSEDIMLRIDFSVCQIAYLFKIKLIKVSKEFLCSYSTKTIIYNEKTTHPISSLMRLDKYLDRGYVIHTIEKLKIILSIVNLNIKTFGDLKYSLQGVSTSYFKEYLEFLNSEDMKEMQFSLEAFIKNYNEFKEAQQILEKLENH